MKICHVVYSYYPFDPRVRKEAEALAKAGHVIHVVAMRDAGEPLHETIAGVNVHRIPMSIYRGGMWRYLFQYSTFLLLSSVILLRLFARHRFHTIHVHSLPDFQVLCALPERILGASVVLDLHESMPEIFAARFRLPLRSALVRIAQALEALSGLVANCVITVNESIAQLLETRGIPRNKLLVVMNSPNLPTKRLISPDDTRKPSSLGGRAVIVYAGGIDPERDLETVVRAASIVAAVRPVSLMMFGRGPPEYRKRLQELVQRSPASLEVTLEGWIPPSKVFELLTLTEIGLAPYQRNALTEIALPNKVFEYAALGKPMVIADLSTMRAFWEGAALFYEPGDATDLATKIEMLLTDGSLATSLAKRAASVYGRHTWARYEEDLLHMYASLDNGGHP